MTNGRPNVRVILHSDQLDHRYYCDVCGELGTGPTQQAAVARARRHAARHPDHWVSMSYLVQSTFFTRVIGDGGRS